MFFGIIGCSLSPIWMAILGILSKNTVEMIETGGVQIGAVAAAFRLVVEL